MYLFEKIILSIIAGLFIWSITKLSFIAYNEAKCLEIGYPKTEVTWNFKAYCINLTGSVTTRVSPQQ